MPTENRAVEMPNSNAILQTSKDYKTDEYYTRYSTIDDEVRPYYVPFLKGKRIICPCDDYRWSNFVRYFKDHFEVFGLAHLTATHYAPQGKAYRYDYDGKEEVITELNGCGDYRSEEIQSIISQSDIIITNPPYSLFRDFMARVFTQGKQYLILGPLTFTSNALGARAIMRKAMWIGRTGSSNGIHFDLPDDYEAIRGTKDAHLKNVRWFTNIGTPYINKRVYTRHYIPSEYQYYKNASAIHIARIPDIPCDFYGLMGVPITILDGFDYDDFEIKGIRYGYDGKDVRLPNGDKPFFRVIIKRKQK